VIRAAGVSALLGASAAIIGSIVGATHGLGGQEIPAADGSQLARLVQLQRHYAAREWMFLAYAVLAIPEGVGLYVLTRRARRSALWALAMWIAGSLVGVVQDAAVVRFVVRWPLDYAAADAATRPVLERLARETLDAVSLQQSVANLLLSVSVVLYCRAIQRTAAAPAAFAGWGYVSAAAGIFYAAVAVAGPNGAAWHAWAERAFGLVVMWDMWAAFVLLGAASWPPLPVSFRRHGASDRSGW
jgi:hypothetical protein